MLPQMQDPFYAIIHPWSWDKALYVLRAAMLVPVGALLWLDANGTLPCEIAIRDLGMDEETARVAEALAREGRVTIIREGN